MAWNGSRFVAPLAIRFLLVSVPMQGGLALPYPNVTLWSPIFTQVLNLAFGRFGLPSD